MKFWIFILGLFSIALFSYSIFKGPVAFQFPLQGKNAPVIQGVSYHEKETVIHFWSLYCSSCIAEIPALNEFVKTHPEYQFVSILIDEDTTELDQKIKDKNIQFPVMFDPSARALSVQFGVIGTPESFLIDKQGVIQAKQEGPFNPKFLDQKVKPL